MGLIEKALSSGVEGAREDEFKIGLPGKGCLEKVQGWLAHLQQPFLPPSMKLRWCHCEYQVLQGFKLWALSHWNRFWDDIKHVILCSISFCFRKPKAQQFTAVYSRNQVCTCNVTMCRPKIFNVRYSRISFLSQLKTSTSLQQLGA